MRVAKCIFMLVLIAFHSFILCYTANAEDSTRANIAIQLRTADGRPQVAFIWIAFSGNRMIVSTTLENPFQHNGKTIFKGAIVSKHGGGNGCFSAHSSGSSEHACVKVRIISQDQWQFDITSTSTSTLSGFEGSMSITKYSVQFQLNPGSCSVRLLNYTNKFADGSIGSLGNVTSEVCTLR
jgi:hypothetical protein